MYSYSKRLTAVAEKSATTYRFRPKAGVARFKKRSFAQFNSVQSRSSNIKIGSMLLVFDGVTSIVPDALLVDPPALVAVTEHA